MKCLVTGAAGFIGSHLCERLLNNGHFVLGIDNLSSGRLENLARIRNDHSFIFIETSINDEIGAYFKKVDWVFHLAGKADIVPSIEDPWIYHETNVTGTVRVLEHSRIHKVKKFIYAASSSCYGIPDEYPTPETSPIRPMYPYALTKSLGEQYVMHWSKVFKLPVVSLRLFNVYGPRSRTSGAYGAVFGVFLSQLANGKPLTVVGDGTQKRDFTHVNDVVSAFVKAAGSELSGEVLNVGTGSPKSINTLVSLLGDNVPVEYLPKRPGEPDWTFCNPEKIQKLLGWTPLISFESGVKIMRSLVADYAKAPLWDSKSIEKATKPWFDNLGEN